MTRPPLYPQFVEPGVPQWRRWGRALLMLWGAPTAALLALWPEGRTQLELWLWSAVVPVSGALAFAVRVLLWQIGQFRREVYNNAREADLQRWWQRRGLSVPVQQVLLLGPAGDEQQLYQELMAATPAPEPSLLPGATQPTLHCRLSVTDVSERAPALARHLARLSLTVLEQRLSGSTLRGIAWVGETSSEVAFTQALTATGVTLPETRLPLADLTSLDALIEGFYQHCRGADDWLLCAGVVSEPSAQAAELPGEAGFLWVLSRQGQQRLHRGEYLLSEAGESAVELCAQVQRYAALEAPPPSCLALDKPSQEAFVEGGWPAAAHQLSAQWGVLGNLAPFIGMSLALLQAQEAGQPCGWQAQDAEKRLAIGVAVPHGNS